MNSAAWLILPMHFLKGNEIISKDVGKCARSFSAPHCGATPSNPIELCSPRAGVGRHYKPAAGWAGSIYHRATEVGWEANSPSRLTCCMDALPLHADKTRP